MNLNFQPEPQCGRPAGSTQAGCDSVTRSHRVTPGQPEPGPAAPGPRAGDRRRGAVRITSITSSITVTFKLLRLF
eukprot:366395-Rhodomonas_salina.2